MHTSGTMITYLADPGTTMCPLWKMTARDGLIAAYVMHSRGTSGRNINSGGAITTRFTFNGQIYKPSTIEASRPTRSIGLNPNSVECSGVFDDIVTKSDVEGGRWKEAEILYELVNFLDLSMGSTAQISGFTGKFDLLGTSFKVEFRSKASKLHSLIGELTTPIDRNPFPAGVNPIDFTFARNIISSTNRSNFVVDGTVEEDDYWQYGTVVWTSGANVNEPPMEIKASVGNTIELQLPMRSAISVADEVNLLAGYNGTRDQARDKFGDAEDLNSEPDLPGLKGVITYPV